MQYETHFYNRIASLQKLKISDSAFALPKPANSNATELNQILGSLPHASVIEAFNQQISPFHTFHETMQVSAVGPVIVGFN